MDLYFILMAPARPENVGAAARAMKTMGFSRLRVVASQAHRQPEAFWVAHGAQELLEQAEAFTSLPEALLDMDLVIATTARQRGQHHVYLTPAQVKAQLLNKSGLQRVGILFGCEESGLSNEQLAHADLISYLPLKVGYPSLNLGQAIMLYAYEMSALLDTPPSDAAVTLPAEAQVHALKRKIEDILVKVGVGQNEKLHHWALSGISMLGQRDLNLMHLLCKDLSRALENEEGIDSHEDKPV
ncbi:tRNA/rRNA methyltransferase [Pseudaeromonas sharmana]|uniref:tRNA (cytidine/uridine-2'-O-)-methyltransferase TrmJ n=1 Tax=Pseudaeromonas sharmana TaxID=328412 RepID=A0ABV8CSH2_9GAMM